MGATASGTRIFPSRGNRIFYHFWRKSLVVGLESTCGFSFLPFLQESRLLGALESTCGFSFLPFLQESRLLGALESACGSSFLPFLQESRLLGALVARQHVMGSAPLPTLASSAKEGGVSCRRVWFKYLKLLIFFPVFLLSAGCQKPTTPSLLVLSDIEPTILEPGTEMYVSGDGFPEHRNGELRLEGAVFSPGREPRQVSWTLRSRARSTTLATAELDQSLLLELTEGAAHSTFRGRVRLWFPPQRPGAPALTGASEELSFDLFPGAHAAERPEADEPFSEHLGLTLAPDLTIASIEPGSEAEQTGLRVNDRLHSLDGVRLLSRADFVPKPRGVSSTLSFSRKGYDGRAEVHLPRAGFVAIDPARTTQALFASGALCLAVLVAARPPQVLIWLSRPRRSRNGARHSSASGWSRGLMSFCCVLAGLWLLLRVPTFWELDLILLLTCGMLPLFMAAFLAGGASNRVGRVTFSFVGALSGVMTSAWGLLPVLIATLFLATEVGSLGLTEFIDTQGPLPDSWWLFHSPWATVLALSYLMALVPRVGRRPPVEGLAEGEPFRLALVRLLERVGTLALLGLWTVLFAGGTAGVELASWTVGVLLAAKLLLLSWGMSWVRVRAGGLRRGEAWSLFGPTLSVASACLAISGFWLTRTSALQLLSDHLRGFSLVLGGGASLLLLIAASRSLAHEGRQADPWM